MMDFSRRRVLKGLLICVGALGIGSAVAMAEGETITFNNQNNKEPNIISLTDKRSFEAVVDLPGKSTKELEDMAKNVTWKLTREKGKMDEKDFPYQYKGDDLKEWKTFPTTVSEEVSYPEAPFFKDIKTEVKGEKIVLTFNNEYMYGVNGIDGRARAQVRNSISDFTGEYQLEMMDKDKVVAKTEVEVKPYDNYHLYSVIDESLVDFAKTANEKGIYAEVKEFGKSSNGRPMQALFVASNKQVLEDYEKLNERAMKDPEGVLKEVESGKLDYKVPIVYSNIHSDENPGVDSVMEFTKALVDNADGSIPYRVIDSMTEEGKKQVEKEKEERGIKWSELVKDQVTGVGYIRDGVESKEYPGDTDAAADLSDEQMNKFYNIKDTSVDVKDMLEDVFFILVPSENVDAHAANVRTNGNGFDLNRDNTYQTQAETQAMTEMIAHWNPVNLYEIHGFYSQFQVEPCSPTHDPNVEYDLFIENAIQQGEAFGSTAIVNNKSINSFQMPARDYLKKNDKGEFEWEPFDDMSTSYTPQYSFLHGTLAYTVEVPVGNEDATQAVKYALVNNGKYVGDNKQAIYSNQLKGWVRGMKNEDAETIRPYYVSQKDEIGKEADVFREKHKENNNFFPEYYVIPMENDKQFNKEATSEIVTYLMRNDVIVSTLSKETKIKDVTYPEGTLVVDMHQAKRNMANAVLYDNIVIDSWTSLYSEPLTAFSDLRGFSMDVITEPGAFKKEELKAIETFEPLTTEVVGKGKQVVLSNNSLAAVSAVNELLKAKETVSMIEEGDYTGDFLITEKGLDKVKDKYILQVTKIEEEPKVNEITKSPTLYIPGRVEEFMVKEGTEDPFGYDGYFNRLNTNLNWDYFVYGQQLNFDLTDDLEKADVIVGNQALNEKEQKAVLAGKPYIAHGSDAIGSVKELNLGFEFDRNEDFEYDALTTVVYEEKSPVTDKYRQVDDTIMYGFGGNMISKVPEGAKILVKTTKDDLIEGFMSKEHIEKYKGSTQVVSYQKDKVNLLVFANSITNKAHQQDDYRYVTNALFADSTKAVGEKAGQKEASSNNNTAIAIVIGVVVVGGGFLMYRGNKNKVGNKEE